MMLIRDNDKPYLIYSIGELCQYDKMAFSSWTIDKTPYRRIDEHLAIASNSFNPGLIYLENILKEYSSPIDLDIINFDVMPRLYNKMGELELRNAYGNVKSIYFIFYDDDIYLINDISIVSRLDGNWFNSNELSSNLIETSFNLHKNLSLEAKIKTANLELSRYGLWFKKYFIMISTKEDKIIKVGE